MAITEYTGRASMELLLDRLFVFPLLNRGGSSYDIGSRLDKYSPPPFFATYW